MPAIVLYQPEIAPNTGNIIRLTANTGCALHLIEPLGFALDDRRMRRAGLDHVERARIHRHASLEAAQTTLAGRRWLALSTRGTTRHDQVDYRTDDVFLFGPETRGLPAELLAGLPTEQRVFIPQRAESRSLNLANAVAVVVYEAWRQNGFN
ncbi:MAG: tRNA (cytidine(34)-2'-O)-methyltransferase [Wenzhouxiangellaceae bacterium]|nr:tRNA (cytidine(34)-2'-O)-methyltransferase [Wenzhouxiangellaceae bacterium]